MQVHIKTFDELNTIQLYHILRLRSQVFVVEQDCVYQDIDNKDQLAIHVIGYHDESIVAYTRIFKPGDYFKQSSIGRVVVNPEFRGKSYGKSIMRASMDYIHKKSWSIIIISAQCYLDKFYKELGFESTGEEYLEDGIPHQKMKIIL
ncbi:GNAT family acetyltransferase [Nonlabens sp. MIC269]|uniref:GNAT family N-acetyltransferase n=1 Tax=Nonlabens sp. MIC269 TaxID=1476901 RepID=UPI000722B1E0|nr:GNAT family N-acetyltransferase [Nonlabens sp. MIC269]ALM21071.1 GNAT family acetyltransferase [Nonlabens sp. MIC269]